MFKVGEKKLLIQTMIKRINDLDRFILNSYKTKQEMKDNPQMHTPEMVERRKKHIAKMEHEKEKLLKLIEKLEQ